MLAGEGAALSAPSPLVSHAVTSGGGAEGDWRAAAARRPVAPCPQRPRRDLATSTPPRAGPPPGQIGRQQAHSGRPLSYSMERPTNALQVAHDAGRFFPPDFRDGSCYLLDLTLRLKLMLGLAEGQPAVEEDRRRRSPPAQLARCRRCLALSPRHPPVQAAAATTFPTGRPLSLGVGDDGIGGGGGGGGLDVACSRRPECLAGTPASAPPP